ncbi:MAG: hypothetical protein QNJ35_17615 [Paracoccaceae bacterium]|nr:hypothetical protein [Paracoccaceae bacterium]
MRPRGPSRGEHLFRFWASLGALVLCGVAIWARGVAINIVTIELAVITLAFFGGGVVWSARALWLGRDQGGRSG